MRAWRKVPVVSSTARACTCGAIAEHHAGNLAALGDEGGDLGLVHGEVRLGEEDGLDDARVGVAVTEDAGGLDGGALGGVERLEVGAGAVGGVAHLSAERIELAHEVALGGAAHGGVAAHDGGAVALEGEAQRLDSPMRAQARAASQPAWPRPTTMTSYRCFIATEHIPSPFGRGTGLRRLRPGRAVPRPGRTRIQPRTHVRRALNAPRRSWTSDSDCPPSNGGPCPRSRRPHLPDRG